MRHGNLLLAGDAAHTVPPTGAKGLNLALDDVAVLARRLAQGLRRRRPRRRSTTTRRRRSRRVWKAQHFSYWMTTMLHRPPDASDFDLRRQLGELTSLVSSPRGAGGTYLAEAYTGWPDPS